MAIARSGVNHGAARRQTLRRAASHDFPLVYKCFSDEPALIGVSLSTCCGHFRHRAKTVGHDHSSMTAPTHSHCTPFADLSGRRAVVTGSSSGIGRGIALAFARGGADVVVHCGQSLERARDVAEEVRALGRKADVIASDLREERNLAWFVESAWDFFGGADVWVNNAGADLLTGAGAALSYSEKLQLLFDVDIRATALLSRIAGDRMRQAGHGVILNIGWDQADRGMEGDSGELFSTAKNAIMGLTRALALSLAPRVRVNCIAPGWIRTAWGEEAGDAWQQRVLRETPLKRWGTPDDVGRVARFLASDDAAYLTGQVVNVNGGAVR
jgi:3-oxoacyl-[acyl-carrier protein] reductase